MANNSSDKKLRLLNKSCVLDCYSNSIFVTVWKVKVLEQRNSSVKSFNLHIHSFATRMRLCIIIFVSNIVYVLRIGEQIARKLRAKNYRFLGRHVSPICYSTRSANRVARVHSLSKPNSLQFLVTGRQIIYLRI